MPAPADLEGRRFGRLIALRPLRDGEPRGKTPGRWWLCRCDCGAVRPVAAMWLLSRCEKRNTRSCGCLQREAAARQAGAASEAAAARRKRK